MKNFKIYNGIKRMIAGVLVPISLIGTTMLLNSCDSKEEVRNYEEETIDDLKTILNQSSVEVSVNYYQTKYKKEATICVIGKDKKDKTYTEEEFYNAFNHLLACTNKEVENLSLELIDYENQIDFRKLQIPEEIKKFSVKISHSECANIDALVSMIKQLTLIESDISNFEDVIKLVNKQKGTIIFGETTNLTKLEMLISKNPNFVFYDIQFNSAEKVCSILPYLKAEQLSVDLKNVEKEIVVNDEISFLSFYGVNNNSRITAGDESEITLFVDELELNSPLIESLSNISRLMIYPEINEQNKEIYSIEITENGCIATSSTDSWIVPYDVIDGKREYYLFLEDYFQKSLYISL